MRPGDLRAALAALTITLAGVGCPARADDPPGDAPVELGKVRWGRDMDAALAEATRRKKPVFALFQEVPGCSTCVRFGEGPLSHPLLVEAIEDAFCAVAIKNNKGGSDEAALARFSEPAWSNPVVRFLDGAGKDLLPRRADVWTTGGIARRMVAALEAAERDVPPYLALVAAETAPGARAEAVFRCPCYWDGEARLGRLGGVLSTRAGWLGSSEVVEVVYDPDAVSAERLVTWARDAGLSRVDVEAGKPAVRDATAPNRKFALRRSPLGHLPLSPLQQARVNAALRLGAEDPLRWLSPRQRALLKRVEAALAKDPTALEGCDLPDATAALPEAQARLEKRLADLGVRPEDED